MSKKYTITVTEKQAQALQNACEVAARIGMYQLHEICCFLPQKNKKERVIAGKIYKQLWDMWLRYLREAGSDDQRPPETVVLWDLYQVIRHRLAWDAHPEGGIGVQFYEPLKMGDEELAKIEVVDNG